MSMNFDGVFYDFVAGWMGTDGKKDLPPTLRVGGLWWPVWDPETYKLIALPEGVCRVMVGFTDVKGIRCEFLYWDAKTQYFYWDAEFKEPVYEQLLAHATSWTLEPEPPQIW